MSSTTTQEEEKKKEDKPYAAIVRRAEVSVKRMLEAEEAEEETKNQNQKKKQKPWHMEHEFHLDPIELMGLVKKYRRFKKEEAAKLTTSPAEEEEEEDIDSPTDVEVDEEIRAAIEHRIKLMDERIEFNNAVLSYTTAAITEATMERAHCYKILSRFIGPLHLTPRAGTVEDELRKSNLQRCAETGEGEDEQAETATKRTSFVYRCADELANNDDDGEEGGSSSSEEDEGKFEDIVEEDDAHLAERAQKLVLDALAAAPADSAEARIEAARLEAAKKEEEEAAAAAKKPAARPVLRPVLYSKNVDYPLTFTTDCKEKIEEGDYRSPYAYGSMCCEWHAMKQAVQDSLTVPIPPVAAAAAAARQRAKEAIAAAAREAAKQARPTVYVDPPAAAAAAAAPTPTTPPAAEYNPDDYVNPAVAKKFTHVNYEDWKKNGEPQEGVLVRVNLETLFAENAAKKKQKQVEAAAAAPAPPPPTPAATPPTPAATPTTPAPTPPAPAAAPKKKKIAADDIRNNPTETTTMTYRCPCNDRNCHTYSIG